MDTSSSMKQSSGVPLKAKFVIAKEAANNVIQTLKPNDRVSKLFLPQHLKLYFIVNIINPN